MMKDTRRIMFRHGKRMVVVLWSFIFLLMCSVVLAESVSSKDPLIEHLEFLGYECDLVEAGIRAKHPSKIHLYITYSFGGIRLQTGFPGKSPHSDVGSRYLVTNALMKRFSVIQLFWSEDGSLFAMGWMPGLYEKARFALFMEAWDHDTGLLRQTYDQLKPFLIEQTKDRGNGS
jgi:hypothetical protein